MQRMGWRRGTGIVCCVGLLAVGSAATAVGSRVSASGVVQGPGPVPSGVLRAVNALGAQFMLAPRGQPRVSRREAISNAIGDAPWFGYATGISLARTTKRSEPSTPGTLVWLVSIHPFEAVGPVSNGPAQQGRAVPRHVPAASWFVVAISARTARFVEAQDGSYPHVTGSPGTLSRTVPRGPDPSPGGDASVDRWLRSALGGGGGDRSGLQTVGKQQPTAGSVTTAIALTANPVCLRASRAGPPRGEPIITAGPTRLVTGLFMVGGIAVAFSNPTCSYPPGQSSAGSITITNATRTIAIARTVHDRQLATFDLSPGSYTITGQFPA